MPRLLGAAHRGGRECQCQAIRRRRVRHCPRAQLVAVVPAKEMAQRLPNRERPRGTTNLEHVIKVCSRWRALPFGRHQIVVGLGTVVRLTHTHHILKSKRKDVVGFGMPGICKSLFHQVLSQDGPTSLQIIKVQLGTAPPF